MPYRKVTAESKAALLEPQGDASAGLRERLETIMIRLVGELERRTDTEDKLKNMAAEKIGAMVKTCRESISTLAGVEPSGDGGKMTIVTRMPFEEEGEDGGDGKT